MRFFEHFDDYRRRIEHSWFLFFPQKFRVNCRIPADVKLQAPEFSWEKGVCHISMTICSSYSWRLRRRWSELTSVNENQRKNSSANAFEFSVMEIRLQKSTMPKLKRDELQVPGDGFLELEFYPAWWKCGVCANILQCSLKKKADNASLSGRLIHFPFSSLTRAILFVTHAGAAFVWQNQNL